MSPWVRRLIAANIVVFVLQLASPIVSQLIVYVPAYILYRPWSIITYMFGHSTAGLSHIAFNMLGLLFFGSAVESRLGSRHFIRLYLVSGVAGALFQTFWPLVPIIGASGAVFGVQLAFAKFWPREKIFIWGVLPVEARTLVIAMTVLSIYFGVSGGGNIAHFAHLGGYVGAWIYLALMVRFSSARQWKAKVEAAPKGMESVGGWDRIDLAGIHAINREEVERLIAKIRAEGERSLTTQERVFLSHFIRRPG